MKGYDYIIGNKKEIRTPTHSDELQFIERLITGVVRGGMHRHGDNNIVDLGTHRGASAITMAGVLDTPYGEPLIYLTGKVYALEINPQMSDEAKLWAASSGLDHRIEFIVGNDIDVIDKMDFVPVAYYVDSLHTYAHVSETLDVIVDKVGDKQVLIAGHDYFPQEPSVVAAVDDFLAKYKDILSGFGHGGTMGRVWWTIINPRRGI